ncbi:MAG: DUF4384 domain-containing protein [Chloroflexi bacterium]|nr:DUF4384 domain-containing protein [Chloroflexota bacterium]
MHKMLWLTCLLLVPVLVQAQPSWYRQPEQDFPSARFLVGQGTAAGKTPAERLQLAAENARSELIKTIRVQISSAFTGQITETNKRVDQEVQSRVVSTVFLEVDGIQIAKQEDKGNTAYALAVLDKVKGRQLHQNKVEALDREIGPLWKEAKGREGAGQAESALKTYLRLYPLLARREEAQVVLLALGDFAAAAFDELQALDEEVAVSRAQVDQAVDHLTQKASGSVDDAAAVLAFRLGQQLPSGKRVLVLPFTYGETQFTSPFSRYLAQALGQKLAEAGLQPVQAGAGFQPRGADHQRELGRQAGADLVIKGPYVQKGSVLKVFAGASEVESGQRVGVADVEVDSALLVREHLAFVPQNFSRAQQDAGIFGAGELVGGQLQVEAWTDRGSEEVMLEEGEKITLAVRANQPCYLQLTYHLADGKRALLYNNYYIKEADVNHAVALPDTFVVTAPLGVEVLQVFASTEKFPPVQVRNWEGYEVLAEDLGTYVAQVRGLKKQQKGREMTETRVTITTMPKR